MEEWTDKEVLNRECAKAVMLENFVCGCFGTSAVDVGRSGGLLEGCAVFVRLIKVILATTLREFG